MPRDLSELQTARLLMRRWRPEDREPYAALNADPEVMRYFPSTLDRAASDASAERIEEHFDRHGFGLWALQRIDTSEFIGFTGLSPMPDGVPGSGGYEVGWRLARRAWHQGFATEAARAAVAVAFGMLDMSELWSMTAEVNARSRAVMTRLGMRLQAHFEHPRVPLGSPVRPHVCYHLPRQG